MPSLAQRTANVMTSPGLWLCAPIVPLMTRQLLNSVRAWQMTHVSCTFSSGIDLENIVYYKDDTHYFVMTAKKQSLLEKGVILHVSDQRNVSFALPF